MRSWRVFDSFWTTLSCGWLHVLMRFDWWHCLDVFRLMSLRLWLHVLMWLRWVTLSWCVPIDYRPWCVSIDIMHFLMCFGWLHTVLDVFRLTPPRRAFRFASSGPRFHAWRGSCPSLATWASAPPRVPMLMILFFVPWVSCVLPMDSGIYGLRTD